MQQLPDKYPHFFDLIEHQTTEDKKKNICHIGYFMAIDAEWFESEGRNVVLSYQIATCSRDRADNIIKYVPRGKRLQLSEIIELGIRSVHDGELPIVCRGGKIRVTLMAHNFAAEWSVLADRNADYITKRLSLIRKTPITDGFAIELLLGEKPLNVWIYDTLLLAPATHRSLSKLSNLLGNVYEKKLSIRQHQIEHMDQFLREDPDGFEEYALRDSEVCLKLFFLLQQSLNELAFGPDQFKKLFRTLASAAVSGFTKNPDNHWFKEYLLVLGQVHRPTKKQKDVRDLYPNAKVFPEVYKLVKRSYLGGRNESFIIGRTEKYPETKGRIWIDVDLSSAYPSSMSLCPLIDLYGNVRQTPLRYRLGKRIALRLAKEKITPKIILQAQEALSHDNISKNKQKPFAHFELMLQRVKCRSHARLIRYHATVIDNSLLKRWQAMSHSDTQWNPESYMIPGFARIRFTFPKSVIYPCLPIKHSRYGLIFPRSGETVASAPEILLAVSAGAKIEAIASVELPIATDDFHGNPQGGPYCFFNEHLGKALSERAKYKKRKGDAQAQIYEKLLKEFINSFYGKFSQSINPRNMFRPSTGEMVVLGPSTITEPSVASLTTGLTRAVLSALLLAIERYNRGRSHRDQVSVVSATTDGLLLGISRPLGQPDYSVETEYYVRRKGLPVLKSELNKETDHDFAPLDLQELLSKFGHDGLLNCFAQELPIRQLIHARKTLTGSSEYLEIKHLVDEVFSVKTRGQIGRLASGDIPLLARFGHKPPLSEIITNPDDYKRTMEAGGVTRNNQDGKWLLNNLARIDNGLEKIESYTFITLSSFRKMLESDGKVDLVKQIRQQRSNFDYDWKRELGSDDSPLTGPYEDLSEMLLYRYQMEAIRRTGRIARPEQVRHRVILKQKTTNTRGGEASALVRQFLRGVTKQQISLRGSLTYLEMADILNRVWHRQDLTLPVGKIWTEDALKNAKRQTRTFEPGTILPTLQTQRLLKVLCQEFTADYESAARLLFTSQQYLDENAAQIKEVVLAVLHAADDGIEPFRALFHDGLLPDKSALLTIFRPILTETMLTECEEERFLPARRYSSERPNLTKLFYRLGLTKKQAERCAQILAPPAEPRSRTRRNPSQKRCIEHFVIALQMGDIQTEVRKSSTVVEKLSRYGLTRTRFYELQKNRVMPRSLSNSPQNQKQIERMAKALRLDPTPFLDFLIDR